MGRLRIKEAVQRSVSVACVGHAAGMAAAIAAAALAMLMLIVGAAAAPVAAVAAAGRRRILSILIRSGCGLLQAREVCGATAIGIAAADDAVPQRRGVFKDHAL